MACIVVPGTSTSPEDGWGNICLGLYVLSEAKILQSTNRIESTVLADPGFGPALQGEQGRERRNHLYPELEPQTLSSQVDTQRPARDRTPRRGWLLWRAPRHRRCLPRRFAEFLRTVRVLYEDAPLKTVFLERNLGLPRLRNLAMRMSRYRYVCMLDADNELVADNLPLFLQSGRQTGAAMVHGLLIDKRQGKMTGVRSENVASMRLTAGNYIDAFALLDSTKVLRAGGFVTDQRLYGYEDWEMILHLIAEEEEVVFVPVVMGYYHLTPGSMYAETAEDKGPYPTLCCA